jgi:hypothetical protein
MEPVEKNPMEKLRWSFLLLPLLIDLAASTGGSEEKCEPTEPGALGPFYKPGAPVRASVGMTLVTQHCPQEGQSRGTFDLVLEPSE